MKIAINCVYFGEKSGGLGEYIYNLCKNLITIDKKNEYIFYISSDQEQYWKQKLPNINNYKLIPFRLDQKVKRSLFQKFFWIDEERKEKIDIFHSPFYHIPSGLKCLKIITFHDLRLKNFPKTYPLKRRLFIQYAIRNSIVKANKIITVSKFTKNELIKFYSIPEKKIIPIHEGLDFQRFDIKNINPKFEAKTLITHNIKKGKYILSVGHIEPRKNYSILIKAFNILNKKYNIDFKLIIVGKKYYKSKKILKLIQSNKNIIYLDFIDEKELLCIYKNAFLLAFPSIYEGFGFPPLEAACFNIPSIVSNVSSIPEICGKGSVYFNPHNLDDIVKKIYIMINNKDLYNKTIKKALKNLKRFSWEKNVKKTIEIYNQIKKK